MVGGVYFYPNETLPHVFNVTPTFFDALFVSFTGGEGLGEEAAKFILAEVILGLEHMHAHGFVHRDIKVRR